MPLTFICVLCLCVSVVVGYDCAMCILKWIRSTLHFVPSLSLVSVLFNFFRGSVDTCTRTHTDGRKTLKLISCSSFVVAVAVTTTATVAAVALACCFFNDVYLHLVNNENSHQMTATATQLLFSTFWIHLVRCAFCFLHELLRINGANRINNRRDKGCVGHCMIVWLVLTERTMIAAVILAIVHINAASGELMESSVIVRRFHIRRQSAPLPSHVVTVVIIFTMMMMMSPIKIYTSS